MKYLKLFEDNKSLVLYHGSPNYFKIFDIKFLGNNMGKTPSNKRGFFFTDNKDVAETFGKYLYSCNIIINNPLILDAKGANYSEYKCELNE